VKLSAKVAPLPAATRGLEAELAMHLPSDVACIEEAVELVARHLEAHFVDRRTIRFNCRVALSEALANAIQYGNQCDEKKRVGVRVLFGKTAIEMEVTDEGDGFDPASLLDPTSPERLSSPDGRGIFLIRRLVDEVRFNDRGNAICMIVRRA
jgi:anti-sigma regulatory factor (Ser/Thr protein kinase)